MRPNPILQYWEQIEQGKIAVSQKVYKQYKKLVNDILNPRDPWVYDNDRAWHAIDFIEKYCKHSKGKWGGKPVILELWQKALIAAAFGFIDKNTGLRKYTEVLLIVARKNGKSTLSAAVGLYLMIADGEPGAEIYAVATKEDQAKIIWKEAKRMVKKSPALNKRIKCLVKEIVGLGRYEDSFFKPVGSDSDTLDGLNVHGACMDEIHAWKDKNLYDVIYDGMTAREQPMLFETTTAGTVRELVYDEKYDYASKVIDGLEGFEDERLLPIIYELGSRDEWTKPECWEKANPGLGTIKDRQKLAEKVEKAKRVPSLVSNLLTKDFDVVDNGAGDWLPYEVINSTETFDIEEIRDCYAIGGCDLSSTTDLTCATLLVMKAGSEKKYVLQQYFLPGELLEQRVTEDKIPYDKWRDRGLLTACEGFRVNYSDVTAWFVMMYQEYGIRPLWIYYDRALAGYWVEDMKTHGFEMVKCAQGAITFNQPMRNMEADLRAKNINYNNNPILKWCLTNVTVKHDDNDMIRPIKGTSTRKRIDGMVSLLDAYVGLSEKMADYLNII
ncbi:MAG TPA: terminase large subunit [Sedimentibacter sp.]|nr:terminase large subunit [Sedimentibacter sp.]